MTDRNGNATTFSYNSFGIDRITDCVCRHGLGLDHGCHRFWIGAGIVVTGRVVGHKVFVHRFTHRSKRNRTLFAKMKSNPNVSAVITTSVISTTTV